MFHGEWDAACRARAGRAVFFAIRGARDAWRLVTHGWLDVFIIWNFVTNYMFACLYFILEVMKAFSMVHFTGVCIYVCMCSLNTWSVQVF